MGKEYYLGLDIGTNSVGWAATDTQYHLCKFKKKDMWGIRLFDEANTAEERRLKRTGRRRLGRRRNRILLLQSLFAESISKVDETFFVRLNESRLWQEDKSVKCKHPLFTGKEYSDIEYYKEYPTIFHLRKELISNTEPHDVRLVYLALHHILKYRGHFLISGDLNSVKDFKRTAVQLLELIKGELELDLPMNEDAMLRFESILRDRTKPKSLREKELIELFDISSSEKPKEERKTDKTRVQQICKFILGLKGDVTKLFQLDKDTVSKPSFSFADSNYEDEVRNTLEDELPEKVYLIDSVKSLYDWSILSDILEDEEYYSCAKVKRYQQHRENLSLLKRIVRKYCGQDVYKELFNKNDEKTKSSYSNYVGFIKKNGKKYNVPTGTADDFYKRIVKILGDVQPDVEDEPVLEKLRLEASNYRLLPLQRDKHNSVVPYQVHEAELKKILRNVSQYLPFLNKKDESGLSTSEKIHAILTFRVPYYVGPLNDTHRGKGSNVWIERKAGKENQKIYPWNYKEIIDLEKSNEAFIRRMTNKCAYLLGEDVLPKNSLLYSRFMVLNELNNLKIRNNKVVPELKQRIYRDLFLQRTRVTGKTLLTYLQKELPELEKKDISGFDEDFKASLKSHLDFAKQIFGNTSFAEQHGNEVEEIIKWSTIYGDDARMLVKMIKKVFPNRFTEEQLKKMKGFRYRGWGNFSMKFLKEIVGCDKETGEMGTIMDFLWSTNDNLMQILSSRYTFSEQIDELNRKNFADVQKITYENVVEDLYTSPANKRAIWQTIQITEEIKKVMGGKPKKIFIEMARGGEKEKKRKISRKEQLKQLFSACEKDVRDYWFSRIEKHEERDFNSMKLYLYYTQLGKCMYTGESIDLDRLMEGNSNWDRDHIYPQSKIKDDSIDNLVLANKYSNLNKSNQPISSEIQIKMGAFWSSLLEKGLISKKKYARLTKKGNFTEEELAGFISRQLVETRQATKAVADVFKNIYPESKIVYVKAGLVSDFRKKPLGCLKSRIVNDFHHAKDAYLNIVVGNVYNTRFTDNPFQWIKKDKEYSLNAVFNFDVKRGTEFAWQGPDRDEKGKLINGTGSIKTVRKTMKQNNPLYTEHTYCGKGALFNETLQPKEKATEIQLKKGLDTSKYGGYHSANLAYFTFVAYRGKKGERVRAIIEVPVYVANQLSYNPNVVEEYCRAVRGFEDVEILVKKIKKNALISVDGFPMRIRGYNAEKILLKSNLQFIPKVEIEENIRRIEKYLEKKADFDIVEKFDNISDEAMNETYDYLWNKIRTVYKNRPSNQGDFLEKSREVFYALSLKEKVNVISEILHHVSCNATHTSNLKAIRGVAHAGLIAINKNTLGKRKLVLINQSVTGLFENRIEL